MGLETALLAHRTIRVPPLRMPSEECTADFPDLQSSRGEDSAKIFASGKAMSKTVPLRVTIIEHPNGERERERYIYIYVYI